MTGRVQKHSSVSISRKAVMSNYLCNTIASWKTEAGLSTAEIARRMHASRSTVSRLEQHPENARLKDIIRYVEACGVEEPVLRLQRRKRPSESLKAKSGEIRSIIAQAATDGINNFRIFGSVSRGEDTEISDVDILVDCCDDGYLLKTMGLIEKFQRVLHIHVDVMAEQQLKDNLKSILDEARPIEEFLE